MSAEHSRVAGAKQVRRALESGRAIRVYFAMDADPAITEPLAERCAQLEIPVEWVATMKQLGAQCGIAVGTAVAAQTVE